MISGWLIEQWPPREKGGQHTNGPEPPGVRVTHLPTGLQASCDVHRSQHKNREVAQSMVDWGLLCLK